MKNRVLFVSPAKMYPVDADARPMQYLRTNVSMPALKVLGSLKSYGFGVDFMDLAADGYKNQELINEHTGRFGLPDEAVVDRINETDPLALLLTSMFTSEQRMVDDLAAKVKKAFPNLPIIAGGIHATQKPEWLLESGNIDYVVLGEGEETAPRLLKALLRRGFVGIANFLGLGSDIDGGLESVGCIAYKKGDEIKVGVTSPTIINLDRPWAFKDVLLRGDEYRYDEISSRRGSIYIHNINPDWTRTFVLYYSKGCQMHCDYCATSERDGMNTRHAGSKRMLEDFKMLHEKYGANIFINQADNFGLSQEDIEFLKTVAAYRRSNNGFAMNNPNAFSVRTFFPSSKNYSLDTGMLDLLKDAGFNTITIAVETFSQRFNKKINSKRIHPESIRNLFAAVHKRGMKTELYMMYGFPDQTSEELQEDEGIVEKHLLDHTDQVIWGRCIILPGTQYYRQHIKDEKAYREALQRGYFFNNLPKILNFTQIPANQLIEFKKRHMLYPE